MGIATTAIVMVLARAAQADPTPAAQVEIDHLLAYVAASSCTFVRNGEPHPASDARDHLADKFDYVKGRITTADEFIRYVATESSISHQPYKVKCGPTEVPAGAWLAEELKRYRVAAAPPAKK